jgi:hypothetical protein
LGRDEPHVRVLRRRRTPRRLLHADIALRTGARRIVHAVGCWLRDRERHDHRPYGRRDAGFFPATRGAPLLGRLFFVDGDGAGAPVVVLSSRLWETTFGKDPAIIGRAVRLDGRRTVIVGVMPDQFQIPAGTDVWTPQTPR